MTILITGGAGYIGSHVVRLLRDRGEDVVVVDDLSSGSAERVGNTPLVTLDLAADGAVESLETVIRAYGVDSVVHFAAFKQVAESVAHPTRYFDCNVGGLTSVLAAIERTGVQRLVFSSSAAVYGEPDVPIVTEDVPCAPINPYGQSKLVGEWMTRNAAAATGLRVANLRYFNVAGTGWTDLRDRGAANLIPLVIDAVLDGRAPLLFGDAHSTPDGSCVRDYVHVLDLAAAHLAALDHLRQDDRPFSEFNIGTGRGSSVFEVIRAVERTAGHHVPIEVVPPRAGDPASVVADASRANEILGWHAGLGLDDIVRSAWEAARAARSTLQVA